MNENIIDIAIICRNDKIELEEELKRLADLDFKPISIAMENDRMCALVIAYEE